MPQYVELTEKDKKILKHIQKSKIATGQQIHTLFYEGTTSAMYQRLSKLCKHNYVGSAPYFNHIPGKKGKRKAGSYYYLDTAGIRHLLDAGHFTKTAYPSKLLPPEKDIGFYITLGDLHKHLITQKIIPPGDWKFGTEAKAELKLRRYVPLFGVAETLYIFRAVSKIPPPSIKTILDTARNLPRSVVLCADRETRDRILDKYVLGEIHLILQEDMFEIIPELLTSPAGQLNELTQAVLEYAERLEVTARTRNYLEANSPEGPHIIADTATGSASALLIARNRKGGFLFMSARNRKQICNLPLSEEYANIILPDGNLLQGILENGKTTISGVIKS